MTAPQEEITAPQEEITAPVEESLLEEASAAPAEEADAPERAEIIMDRDPGEPEGNINDVPLTRIMSETVEAVLEENDEILEVQPTWRERLAERFAAVKERRPAKEPTIEDTEELWDHPEAEEETEPEKPQEPEPDMEQADHDEKQRMKKLRSHLLAAAVPALLAVVVSVLHELIVLPEVWRDHAAVRCGVLAALLVLTALGCADVWKEMTARLRDRRVSCETAAALAALVSLADCVYGAVTGKSENLPLSAAAAVLIWLCQYGLLLSATARRAGFHLANLGGTPPYVVSRTAAGVCKQKGRMEGFYRMSGGRDPVRVWQSALVPLLLSAATVLAGVVCLSRKDMSHFLWVWSAMLSASLPLSLPLTMSLPLQQLNARLQKSGSAVAGYQGAKWISRGRRMVLTDSDIFPPGTVGLNGLKVYGEEIGKVASYAATVAAAAGSQLSPLFDQLLAGEGGTHEKLEDLHFYEEGGVGGTIRGETVTIGSAYFMKKSRVTLPRDLKLKTGVFLAVDGVLIAVFAIKYQPSRNVEWALRALRRNRIEPVLAVRGGNITPSLQPAYLCDAVRLPRWMHTSERCGPLLQIPVRYRCPWFLRQKLLLSCFFLLNLILDMKCCFLIIRLAPVNYKLLVLVRLVLTLLQKSAHAFLLIGGLEAAAEQLFFHDDRTVHIDLQSLIDGFCHSVDTHGLAHFCLRSSRQCSLMVFLP